MTLLKRFVRNYRFDESGAILVGCAVGAGGLGVAIAPAGAPSVGLLVGLSIGAFFGIWVVSHQVRGVDR